jgi:tetratricopeptide (TPR) repeat protein
MFFKPMPAPAILFIFICILWAVLPSWAQGVGDEGKLKSAPVKAKEAAGVADGAIEEDIEIQQNESGVYEVKTKSYLNVKQPKKAIQDLNVALATEPNNDSFYFQRGCAYEEIGNYRRACEEYTHAIFIKQLAKYFLARAHCYKQMNQPSLATADLRHAHQANPKLPRRIVFKDDL